MEEHLFNLSFVVSSLYWSLEPLRPPWWRQVVKQIETIHFSGSNCAPFWIQRGTNGMWTILFQMAKLINTHLAKTSKKFQLPAEHVWSGWLGHNPKRSGWKQHYIESKPHPASQQEIFYFHTKTVLSLSYFVVNFFYNNQTSKPAK